MSSRASIHNSSTCNLAKGTYDFQVLRPLGGDQYLVLGDTGNQTDPCNSQLLSYPVSIPVQAGDVIGVYVVNEWQGYSTSVADPAARATAYRSRWWERPSLCPFPVTIDESATLVTGEGPPTSGSQCKHDGWKNFPQFKNQGDCVSFVATGGKNPPTGS